MMKTFSLRTRLTLLLATATLIALGLAAQVVDWRADAEMRQRFDASLLARAQAFSALVQRGNNGIKVDAMIDRNARFPGSESNDWYAVTCNGEVIDASVPAPPPMVATDRSSQIHDASLPNGRALRVVVLNFRPDTGPGDGSQAIGADAGSPVCELRYALDRGPLDDILRTLDWILLGSIFGACALVLTLTPWLVGRGMQPLAVLDLAMATIGPDTPGKRLPASNTSELTPVVARFNDVLARMDDGLVRERQFASGLAHEFRTRLAELRTLVDVETRYPSGRDIRRVLGEVGTIGVELEATVTALLQLTRIQSGLEPLRPETVPLSPLVARLVARQHDAAHARGVHIETDPTNDAVVAMNADRAMLEIVLDNVLGNAVAYSPTGSTVVLRASENGFVICNAAPALQPGDLANFGQRFWRKHAHSADHAGLGLALANAAARALGMTLEFELIDGILHAVLRWPHDAAAETANINAAGEPL